MSAQKDSPTGASRERARARLRTLTGAALLATTGATAAIGIVVAREDPGKSGASTTTSRPTTGKSTGTNSSGSTGSTGNTGNSADTGSTGNTGNTGSSSYSPSTSSQSPSVTSGGSGR